MLLVHLGEQSGTCVNINDSQNLYSVIDSQATPTSDNDLLGKSKCAAEYKNVLVVLNVHRFMVVITDGRKSSRKPEHNMPNVQTHKKTFDKVQNIDMD